MRKVTAGPFISLDGVVQDPRDWDFPYFNDETGAAVSRRGTVTSRRPSPR